MWHILEGKIDSFAVQIFQYRYTSGVGRLSETRTVSVFVYNTSHHLPHCYLNRKNNRHVTIPPNTKKLPMSPEFAERYDVYVAPEYEIEALALFNDAVQRQILAMHWQHDIELVNDYVYVIQDRVLSSEVMFEAKLQESTQYASYLHMLASAMHFEPIRETPYLFSEVREKLPFWSIDRYGTDTILHFFQQAVLFILLGLLLVDLLSDLIQH